MCSYKTFLEKDLSPDGMDLEGLISRPAAGLQRQAGCHLPHIFHEYPQNYLFQKVFVTCFNKVVSPFVFSQFEQIAGNLLFITSLEIPYTSCDYSSSINPCSRVRPPFFLSGHPSVTNSRFEYTVDGPMWWLTLRRYAPCPWFHHYNSTVTLQRIDVSSTGWWIHSADRCQMWYIFVYHLSLITIPNIMGKAWQHHAIDLVSLEHHTVIDCFNV